MEACQCLLTFGELPDHGGERSQVTVTLPWEHLQHATATLDTREPLTRRPAVWPATRNSYPPCSVGPGRSSMWDGCGG